MPIDPADLGTIERVIALVIGVADQSAWEGQHALPPASVSQQGATRDAWGLARALSGLCAVPTADLRVLADAAAPADWAASGTWAGVATAAAIRTELDAFVDKLAATPDARGVLTFAGNGGVRSDGFVLAAQDTVDLAGAVTLDEVRAKLSAKLCGRGIVVVLDAAFEAAAPVLQDARLRAIPQPAGTANRHLLRAEDLLLAAAAPYRPAYERKLGLAWRGTWSWALEAVIAQILELPAADRATTTWGALGQAASALLSACALGQQPAIWGGTDLALEVPPTGGGLLTVQDQIDAGDVYLIEPVGGGDPLGYVLVSIDGAGKAIEQVVWGPGVGAWPASFDLRQTGKEALPQEILDWNPGQLTVETHPYRRFDLGNGLLEEVPKKANSAKAVSYSVTWVSKGTVELPHSLVRVSDFPSPGTGLPGAPLPDGSVRVLDWFRRVRAGVSAKGTGVVLSLDKCVWRFAAVQEPLNDHAHPQDGYRFAPLES